MGQGKDTGNKGRIQGTRDGYRGQGNDTGDKGMIHGTMERIQGTRE